MNQGQALRRVRMLLGIFILCLILSGLTAFPLLAEVRFLSRLLATSPLLLASWLFFVQQGLEVTYTEYPFIAYGTDWLAFGHLAIAVLFLFALRNPLQNRDMIKGGLVICFLVIPTAWICGAVRGIPPAWRVVDSLFGLLGIIPLALCNKYLKLYGVQQELA